MHSHGSKAIITNRIYYEYWKGLTVENPKEQNRATNCPSYMFAYLIGAQNDENSSHS